MGETGRPSVREVEGPVSVRGLELPGAEGGTLVVEWAEGREEALDLRLETCHSPLCGCATVRLICTARGEPGRERVASLDLRGRCVADSEDGGVEDTAFAEVVASTLTDEQWDELWRHLFETKRAAEERGNLDALELELPDEVATESLMIGYQDVFPFAEMLELTADGRHWAVTDDYCVQPRCSCTEVVLAFFPLPERRPRPGDAGDEPCAVAAAVRYDVARRRWRLEDDPPASSAAVRALMAALEAAVPDLAKVLVERRRRLRRLSARWFARQVPAPVEAAPRVGRNEPCPCGSGRKYKHCCGR